jgi:hypothetical protein
LYLTSTPEDLVESIGNFGVARLKHMLISIRRGGRRVTEAGLHLANRRTRDCRQRSGNVAQIVKPQMVQSRRFDRGVPVAVPEVALAERSTAFTCEDETAGIRPNEP